MVAYRGGTDPQKAPSSKPSPGWVTAQEAWSTLRTLQAAQQSPRQLGPSLFLLQRSLALIVDEYLSGVVDGGA